MIAIRTAHTDDIQALQELNDEIFIDNSKYDTDLDMNWAKGPKGKEYFTFLVNDPQSLCLIVEDEGRKIGYIAAGVKEIDYRNSKYAEVQNMGVTPEYRSKGIGTMLMEKCTEWAKEKGYQKLFVSVYIANQNAIAFYKKSGFVEIDISLEKVL